MQNDHDSQTPLNTQQKSRRKRKRGSIKTLKDLLEEDLDSSSNSPNLDLQNIFGEQIPSDDSRFSYCQSSPVQSEYGGKKKISRKIGLNSEGKPEATENLTPSDEDRSTGPGDLANDTVQDRPETDHKPETVDFSIRMRIAAKTQETFFLYSEPALEFKTPIKLTNRGRNFNFPRGSIDLFNTREKNQGYCYLTCLRFNNVREAFNSIKQVQDEDLLEICKYRFPASLKGFQESEFGNEIILDGSFQILTFRVRTNINQNIEVLNNFSSLFTAVFDNAYNKGIDNLRIVWEKYKRSIGFMEPSGVVQLSSAYDINYSGILSEKRKYEGKNNKDQLYSEFMTLDVNGEKIWPSSCSVKIKRFCINFLHLPTYKLDGRCYIYGIRNCHLEVDVEFENEEGKSTLNVRKCQKLTRR